MVSSGWLPEGEGAFCLHPAGVEILLPGKTKQNVLSNATDRWFVFFFTIGDDNSHNKVLPTHEEPQGVHGHLVSHPFTCFSFYIFQKAKAKITEASFPKDTF